MPTNLEAKTRKCCIGLILVALSSSACRSPEDAPSTCPHGFEQNDAAASRITSTLAQTPEGKALLEETRTRDGLRFCFGRRDVSAVTTEGVLLFDNTLANNEAASRLAHLLHHVADGLSPTPKEGETCEKTVERLLQREADALALEITLRRTLAVHAPKISYEFETTFWQTPAEGRAPLLFAYLKDHPDGAPGIDALASGYERRCRLGLR